LTLDDAAVVQGLLDAREGAWDHFVECYSGLVTAVVRRILGAQRGRGADLDDVVENVFLMLLENDCALLRKYDPQYKLSAYLGVISRTAVHRFLRRQKVKADLPDEMWNEALPDKDALTVSDAAARGEIQSAVRDELAGLSDREQRVLRLFYYDGIDYQGIAEELGVSINSVGAALSRARAKLAKALTDRRGLTESDFRSV
jgi:RNA polymerase sigma-70 factor, ECF subfamily